MISNTVRASRFGLALSALTFFAGCAAVESVFGPSEKTVGTVRIDDEVFTVTASSNQNCVLGVKALDVGTFPEAADFLTKAVQEDPKDDQAHYALGIAKEKLGHYVDAKAQYWEALALVKNNADYTAAHVRVSKKGS